MVVRISQLNKHALKNMADCQKQHASDSMPMTHKTNQSIKQKQFGSFRHEDMFSISVEVKPGIRLSKKMRDLRHVSCSLIKF